MSLHSQVDSDMSHDAALQASEPCFSTKMVSPAVHSSSPFQ